MIYFVGLVPGQCAAVWPAYVVGDDPGRLCFTVAVDSHDLAIERIADGASLAAEGRRQYVTQLTQRRLHQELLDAAHILPDGHPKGEPIVPNGLALSKLHHAPRAAELRPAQDFLAERFEVFRKAG